MTIAALRFDPLEIARAGLRPRAGQPARVVIVGAGMAGLVAAHELLRAGHDPVLIEARARVGGRVETLRAPFSDGLYAEAGAMRIPGTHALTLGYIEKFGLRTRPFHADSPNAYCHLSGQRHLLSAVKDDLDCLGHDLAPDEQGKTIDQLWEATIQPIRERLRREGEAAWASIIEEHGEFSTRAFLRRHGWSADAVELFGLLHNEETRIHASVIEYLREDLHQVYHDLVQIEGGMDRLPKAFLPDLLHRIRFGARLVALEQEPESVRARYQTAGGRHTVEGDYVIVTVPFSVLRHVEIAPALPRRKQRVIRQLAYDAASKIFFQCRSRFWEEAGIQGGSTITDLPVRTIYYPEHGQETGRGVLLASYTFAQDAQRWGSLSPDDRVHQALENVAQIHPEITDEFEVGASKIWHDDEYACGAFALFYPGQEQELHAAITEPAGRVHFAGEHTSLTHGWIQGAIESGLRAAFEIHEAARRT